MTTYEPPRRYSNTRPYDDSPVYNGQTPQVQVQQAPYYPPPPPQEQPSYLRARGSSNGSQHSRYSPPQQAQQQLAPYGQPAPQYQQPYQQLQQQQQQHLQQQGYPQEQPPRQYTPDQLRPADAYGAQDPFAYRQRTASTSSAASHHSRRSSHSHHSHHSALSETQHISGRKDGQRATLGDSLYGIWETMKAMIPTAKR